jgi:nicotinate phosphoribosyltransferase
MTSDSESSRREPHRPTFQPAADVLSGETADVYFERARAILAAERLDPVVTMEIFPRSDGILCGAAEAASYLREIFAEVDHHPEPVVESLHDGDAFSGREVVMRISARYSAFGLYETAILGILASGSGWATAARRVVDAAAPIPVIGFGARHVHPSVADQLDYASVIGGCVGASTPAGARLAGLNPTGTMPHALVLIFGDTVRAAEAFDRHIDPDVPRIVLVDTFKDETEESLRVADALGERLWGVRLDTPSERGRVTPEVVKEVRARLDQAGHQHVRIVVSGGLDAERIGAFKEAQAPVDSFAVGSAISKASPIDFTGDLKEIEGRPVAKRGRIPGRTQNPRLERIDLTG